MNDQNLNSSNPQNYPYQPQPPVLESNLPQTKNPAGKNNSITVVAFAIFILLAIALVVFLFFQNQKLKRMLSSYQNPSPSPTPTTESSLPGWRTINNLELGFQFKVPQDWQDVSQKEEKNKVIFLSGDGLYRLTYEVKNNINPKTSKAYTDLDEFIGLPYKVKSITINGQDARQTLPASGSENYNKIYFFSKDGLKINSLELLVGDGTKEDHRVTGEAITIGADIFEKLITNYKFLALPSPSPSPTNEPTACTMEAKLCPDGSSVGRSGPNCEFAPCPTN